MLQHVLHVYKMNLGFAKRLVGDVSADQQYMQDWNKAVASSTATAAFQPTRGR